MRIKIRYTNPKCKLTREGNMYDLRIAENLNINAPMVDRSNVVINNKLVSLGVAMELPKYFEANIIVRSSLYGKTGMILANHIGEIDGPDDANPGYIGNNDIWKANFIAFKQVSLKAGTKVCQFRIILYFLYSFCLI